MENELLNLLQSLRFACRGLVRTPTATAALVLVLTLGIGVNVVGLSIVSAIFFSPMPHVEDPEMLVRATRFSDRFSDNGWSYPHYEFIKEHVSPNLNLAAYSSSPAVMSGDIGDGLLDTDVTRVSYNYFDVLGVRAEKGHLWMSPRAETGGSVEVVLSYEYWQRHAGGRESIVGEKIVLNRHPCVVVGVTPAGFRGGSPTDQLPDVWLSITAYPVVDPSFKSRLTNTTALWLAVVGRLGQDTTLGAAQAKVDSVSAARGQVEPQWAEWNNGVELLADYRYGARQGRKLTEFSRLMLGITAVVLCIACVNAALLMTARVLSASKATAVKMALGATRSRVMLQVLTESLIVAGLSAGLAVLLSFWATRVVTAFLPYTIHLPSLTLDLKAVAVLSAVVLGTVCLFGTMPILTVGRQSLVDSLKTGDTLAGRSAGREILVVLQIVLTLPLIAGALLFGRSLSTVLSVDLGFDPENRLAVSMQLSRHGYDKARAMNYVNDVNERLSATPGVRRSVVTSSLPFVGSMSTEIWPPGGAEDDRLEVHQEIVGTGYFKTMGIHMHRGRGFTPQDREGMPTVAVVNESAAEKLWPGKDGVGERFIDYDKDEYTVIGVVGNTTFNDLSETTTPRIFVPILQFWWGTTDFIVETEEPAEKYQEAVKEVFKAVDPYVVLTRVTPMTELVERETGPYRASLRIVGVLGASAVLLLLAGLYGVMSQYVIVSRRSFGVRLALGASPWQVSRQVVMRGLRMAILGLLPGLGAAWLAATYAEGFLFGVEPRDMLSLLGAVPLLLCVVFLACVQPAYRAGKLNPVEVLRDE